MTVVIPDSGRVKVACPDCGWTADGELELVDRYVTDWPPIPWCDLREVVADPEFGPVGFCPGCDELLDPDNVVLALACRHCREPLTLVGDPKLPYAYKDASGSTSCAEFFDNCPACQDGESHPHEPTKEAT
jgi:hypothetical protein